MLEQLILFPFGDPALNDYIVAVALVGERRVSGLDYEKGCSYGKRRERVSGVKDFRGGSLGEYLPRQGSMGDCRPPRSRKLDTSDVL